MLRMEITRLIERCRKGDEDALGMLYTAYAQRMKGVCRRYISDEQTVNDVLHDAFVIIFTSFDRLRDTQKAEAWMMTIVRNVAAKYREQLAERQGVALDEATTASPFEHETQDIRGIPLEEVMQLIDKLPEGYGKVFRLSVFEGLSHKEIGRTLGIEPHSSSSQLARAKKMLRKMMQRYWGILIILLLPIGVYISWERKNTILVPPVVSELEDSLKTEPLPISPMSPIRPIRPIGPISPIANLPDTLSHTIAQHGENDSTPTIPTNDSTPAIPISDRSLTLPQRDLADIVPPKPYTKGGNRQRWSIRLAYAGAYDSQDAYNQPYTYKPMGAAIGGEQPTHTGDIDNWNDYLVFLANHPNVGSPQARSAMMQIALNNATRPGEDKMLRTSHHYMPVTMALAMRYSISNRWALETGLTYSRLTSKFEMGTEGNVISERQTIHYVGLPLKGIYNMYNARRWNLYSSAGLSVEMPVRSSLRSHYFVQGALKATDDTSVRAPWQFSTHLGMGVQYHLTPHIGLFAEPSVQYFVPTNSDITTYRTLHPFVFTLPVGMRFTW